MNAFVHKLLYTASSLVFLTQNCFAMIEDDQRKPSGSVASPINPYEPVELSGPRPALTLTLKEDNLIKKNQEIIREGGINSLSFSSSAEGRVASALEYASKGCPLYQYEVSCMYAGSHWREMGVVEKDEVRAFAWCLESALQNHLGAVYGLVKMYEQGIGVTKDEKLADFWKEREKRLEDIETREWFRYVENRRRQKAGKPLLKENSTSNDPIGMRVSVDLTNRTKKQKDSGLLNLQNENRQENLSGCHTPVNLPPAEEAKGSVSTGENLHEKGTTSSPSKKLKSSPPRKWKSVLNKKGNSSPGNKKKDQSRMKIRTVKFKASPERKEASLTRQDNNFKLTIMCDDFDQDSSVGSLSSGEKENSSQSLDGLKDKTNKLWGNKGSLGGACKFGNQDGSWFSPLDEGKDNISSNAFFGGVQDKAKQIWNTFPLNSFSSSTTPVTDSEVSPPFDEERKGLSKTSSVSNLEKVRRKLWASFSPDNASRPSSRMTDSEGKSQIDEQKATLSKTSSLASFEDATRSLFNAISPNKPSRPSSRMTDPDENFSLGTSSDEDGERGGFLKPIQTSLENSIEDLSNLFRSSFSKKEQSSMGSSSSTQDSKLGKEG